VGNFIVNLISNNSFKFVMILIEYFESKERKKERKRKKKKERIEEERTK
jgi:hypothetical protein